MFDRVVVADRAADGCATVQFGIAGEAQGAPERVLAPHRTGSFCGFIDRHPGGHVSVAPSSGRHPYETDQKVPASRADSSRAPAAPCGIAWRLFVDPHLPGFPGSWLPIYAIGRQIKSKETRANFIYPGECLPRASPVHQQTEWINVAKRVIANIGIDSCPWREFVVPEVGFPRRDAG